MSPVPRWAEELSTLLPACAHFLVSGNTDDLYLVDRDFARRTSGTANPASPQGAADPPDRPADRQVLLPLPEVVQRTLTARGIPTLVSYDITSGASVLPRTPEAHAAGEAALGQRPSTPPESLTGLAELVQVVSDAATPVGLLVQAASRLVRDLQHLSDPEFQFYRRVDRSARAAQPGEHGLYNPIIWVLQREQDMPAWLATGNERLRMLTVPLPDTGERRAVAERLVRRLPEPGAAAEPEERPDPAAVLAGNTAGLSLVAMESVIGVAEDQGLGRDRLEDAARAYRVGILDNPWRRPYLAERLEAELAHLDARSPSSGDDAAGTGTAPSDPAEAGATSAYNGEPDGGGSHATPTGGREPLVERVRGQDHAVRKSLDILVRSVTSLTAAHTASASRPRGVLFLAGPTGVGKTELAKGLTKLLFDDERLYVRFDMSEFSSEHAADRLIGAPPGFVGYERGGELTNAVRRQPFSLVLFDEVEKAEPRVLDKFLQLLDDGRLTDGRGETAHFTETVVVFTSNLGIYRDRVKEDEDGNKVPVRELNVDPDKDNPTEVDVKVREGIHEHFTLRLARPELLNRIGDNIVVFDFIRHPTGRRILAKMVANVLARVRSEHRLDVSLGSRARATLNDECLRKQALMMGGRGISSRVETVLVNPLAAAVFRDRGQLGERAELVDLEPLEGGAWQAVLKPG